MTNLVERDGELGQLAAALSGCMSGTGTLVTVVGGFGTGKTALLRELSAAAGHAGAAVTRAHGGGPGRPGAPSGRTVRSPVVLVDDAQYVGEAGAKWLDGLAHAGRLVVCAIRDGEPAADSAPVRALLAGADVTVAAKVLSPRGVALVAERRWESRTGPVPTAACAAATGGIPLLLECLLDAWPALDGSCPPRLAARYRACVRGLPDDVLTLVRALAVLGEHADRAGAAQVCGLPDRVVGEAGDRLVRLGFRPASGWALPPLVAAAARQDLRGGLAERLHDRVAVLLYERGLSAEAVAEHLHASVPGDRPWAARVLSTAAKTSMSRGAAEEAVRHLRAAVAETAEADPGRLGTLVALAKAERVVDDRLAVQHLGYAVFGFAEPRDRAAAVLEIPASTLGAVPAVLREALRGVVAGIGDPDRLAGGDRELALRVEARHRYVGYTDQAELADALARLRGLGDRPVMDSPAERELLSVLVYCVTLTASGDIGALTGIAERVLQLEPATSDRMCGLVPLAVKALCGVDRADRAADWLDAVKRSADSDGDPLERTLVAATRALVAVHRGRLEEARLAAEEVCASAAGNWATTSSPAVIAMAAVALELQDQRLTRLLLAGYPHGERDVCVSTLFEMLRASEAAVRGEPRRALEHLRHSGELLEQVGWRNIVLFPWRSTAARLHYGLGEPDAGRRLLEQELARAREWGAPKGIGRALRTLGEHVPGAEGLELLRESVIVLGASVNRMELARAQLQLGVRLRSGEPDAASALFWSCREIARECGAPALADQAQALARGLIRSGKLTPAELRVARLAVTGRTNVDIAGELAVSVRAVEKHLTSVFRKLGVQRRSDLPTGLTPLS